MKCCDVKVGDLRSSITIERKTVTADGMGGNTEIWKALALVKAKWKALSGSERLQAMRISPGNTYKIIIRFKGDKYGSPYYTISDRIKHRNKTYNIDAVLDVEDARKWLEIYLSEGKG